MHTVTAQSGTYSPSPVVLTGLVMTLRALLPCFSPSPSAQDQASLIWRPVGLALVIRRDQEIWPPSPLPYQPYLMVETSALAAYLGEQR